LESYHTNTENVKKAAIQGGEVEGKRNISAIFFLSIKKKVPKMT